MMQRVKKRAKTTVGAISSPLFLTVTNIGVKAAVRLKYSDKKVPSADSSGILWGNKYFALINLIDKSVIATMSRAVAVPETRAVLQSTFFGEKPR